jgi:hypothetical protein
MPINTNLAGPHLTEHLQETCRVWVHTLETALHSATLRAKSFFVAWALLGQQEEEQKHEETEQPQQTTSPFTNDLTKAIEAARA